MDDMSWSVTAVIIAFIISLVNSYILLGTPDRYYVMVFVTILSILCLTILTKWHPEKKATTQT
ncbi:MAG: hypothetical protein V3R82_03565 [Candidatus Hydrothermarchaeales archaeon]